MGHTKITQKHKGTDDKRLLCEQSSENRDTKKYGVSHSKLYWILKIAGIKLWDLQKEPTNKKPTREMSDDIYYWKKDKSSYAKIFYEFNK